MNKLNYPCNKNHTLSHMRELLFALGNPEKNLSFIHIAGTNGKGSVTAFLESMLISDGKKVGKFTSPHLFSPCERIAVNQSPITEENFLRLDKKVDKKIKEHVPNGMVEFAKYTAIALAYFAEENVDIVLLEVGLGGEFDPTNVIPSPLLSVLTTIDYDHTTLLGDTLEAIAHAKCGILKATSQIKCVVSALQKPEALAVIEKRAKEENLDLVLACPPAPSAFDGIYEKVCFDNLPEVTLSLAGVHQITNAALALAVAQKLHLTESAIMYGLTHATHRGRFEMLSTNPLVLFDGAHNPNGVASLATSLDRYFGNTPDSIVFACMQNKEADISLSLLKQKDRQFFFTEIPDADRSMSKEELYKIAKAQQLSAKIFSTPQEAMTAAIQENRRVVVCGSLYLYEYV